MIQFLSFIAVVVAAVLIGNWFLDEIKQAKMNQLPWYKPYLSLPGIIIISAIVLPVILRIFKVI
jgi:hypothetical protein